jgi:hypothetical protein
MQVKDQKTWKVRKLADFEISGAGWAAGFEHVNWRYSVMFFVEGVWKPRVLDSGA